MLRGGNLHQIGVLALLDRIDQFAHINSQHLGVGQQRGGALVVTSIEGRPCFAALAVGMFNQLTHI